MAGRLVVQFANTEPQPPWAPEAALAMPHHGKCYIQARQSMLEPLCVAFEQPRPNARGEGRNWVWEGRASPAVPSSRVELRTCCMMLHVLWHLRYSPAPLALGATRGFDLSIFTLPCPLSPGVSLFVFTVVL